MKIKPLVVDIKRNALDDGPGIRTLIFFKGCPEKVPPVVKAALIKPDNFLGVAG